MGDGSQLRCLNEHQMSRGKYVCHLRIQSICHELEVTPKDHTAQGAIRESHRESVWVRSNRSEHKHPPLEFISTHNQEGVIVVILADIKVQTTRFDDFRIQSW